MGAENLSDTTSLMTFCCLNGLQSFEIIKCPNGSLTNMSGSFVALTITI